MYHPATRLLTILELLQSYPEMSGKELAGRLEVDVRTVRRYVTMLQGMGMPIEAERGRYGGYRLRPGFKLPPLMFTEEEVLALVLGLLSARELGVGSATPAIDGALAKLERVMPTALRVQAQAIQEALIIETPATNAGSIPSDVVLTLSLAMHQGRQVALYYRRWDGQETGRRFDPYGLVQRVGYWYTAGYCHLRQDLRTFRLDRVIRVQLTDEHFTRPKDFDALKHVEQSIANTPGHWTTEVLLQTTLDEARRQISPTLGTLTEQPEGILLRCYVSSLDWLAHLLVGLDCPLRVIQPPELRQALERLGTRARAMATQK